MSKSTHLQIGKLDIPRPKSSNDETMSTIKIIPKIHFSQIWKTLSFKNGNLLKKKKTVIDGEEKKRETCFGAW